MVKYKRKVGGFMKKIIIKNLGPVKNVELNLDKQFNVFIGEQASGKSTIAKAVYLFTDIEESWRSMLLSIFFKRTKQMNNMDVYLLFHDAMERSFFSMFGLSNVDKDTILRFEFSQKENNYMEINFTEDKDFKLRISRNIRANINNILDEFWETLDLVGDKKLPSSIMDKFYDDLAGVFGESKNTLYIPAARSFINMLDESLIEFIEKMTVDYSIRGFVEEVLSYKRLVNQGVFDKFVSLNKEFDHNNFRKEYDVITNYKKHILKGEYKIYEERECLEIGKEIKVPLRSASSGQQEAVWILNLLTLSFITGNHSAFIIEEPEAHLYPNAQLDLVKYIVMIAKLTGSRVLITTHSPYVLNAMNLLAYSGIVEGDDDDSVNHDKSIVEERYRVPKGELLTYQLKDGYAQSIMDEELLIKSERIDGVTEIMNDLFNKIIDKAIDKSGELNE